MRQRPTARTEHSLAQRIRLISSAKVSPQNHEFGIQKGKILCFIAVLESHDLSFDQDYDSATLPSDRFLWGHLVTDKRRHQARIWFAASSEGRSTLVSTVALTWFRSVKRRRRLISPVSIVRKFLRAGPESRTA